MMRLWLARICLLLGLVAVIASALGLWGWYQVIFGGTTRVGIFHGGQLGLQASFTEQHLTAESLRIESWARFNRLPRFEPWLEAAYIPGQAAQLLVPGWWLGIPLLIAARMLSRAARRPPGSCPQCGVDLSTNAGWRCQACGRPVTERPRPTE